MSKRKQKLYLATNGETYDWDVSAIFSTREAAERYCEEFIFASHVEEWTLDPIDLSDQDLKAYRCRYDDDGTSLTCTLGALSYASLGTIDGYKRRNRGTEVMAHSVEEAVEKAREIIRKRDGDIYG